MKSLIVKRSIMIAGHKTSVSLEDPFWSGLKEIAHYERATVSDLVAKINRKREHGNLSSAIRLFVLDQVRMLRLTAATLMLAVALTASFPTTASANVPPPPPPPPPPIITHGTSGAAGAGATAGFIGFVAVLVGYDLLRRTTCVGDFLYLGGPGFTEKMPVGNVMIPQCPIVKTQPVVRTKG